MQYTLSNVQHKEYEGRKYVLAHAKALDGQELDVSLGDKWGERLVTFKDSDQIEANPWQNPKNSKWSLYPPDEKKRSTGQNQAFKQKVIEETMARKEQSIAKSQDNKEWGIKVSSTMNKAIDLAIAEIRDIKTLNTLEQDILKWRKWIWDNWDVNVEDIDPTDGTLNK